VILYVDTSAVVKLLLDEPGTDAVGEWLDRAQQVASSVITYAEASAALARNDRLRGADPAALRLQLIELDRHWLEFVRLPVAERLAGRIALDHRLRGMDSVQLAAAIGVRQRASYVAPSSEVIFATFDRRLLEAAEREGFATLGDPPA